MNMLINTDVGFRDVDEAIRKSQEPMYNVLMLSGSCKRAIEECSGGDVSNDGINNGNKKVRRAFKQATEDQSLIKLTHKNFAPESKKKMKWAVNMYCEWRVNRLKNINVPLPILNSNLDDLYNIKQEDLCYSLSCFIGEIKKVDNSEYLPNTLKEIIVMIQMFLHEKGVYWKLLDQQSSEFQSLHNVVDNLMKQRTAEGLGARVSSSVISLAQEDTLYFKGILGEEDPSKLLKTVIYLLGLHLALRGGVEHARLRRPGFDCQITIGLDDKGRERLVYREDPLQKNNQGGIGTRNSMKIVYVYGSSNYERCPVRLFKKYCRLLPPPKTCRKLYLRPKQKPTPSVWYCDQSYGNNKVCSTVKDICKEAGFEGKFTNHSLRATAASRMYQSDVPEQIIKEITGHRSDCVRLYKRTSDDIKLKASSTISGENCINLPEKKVEVAQHTEECSEVTETEGKSESIDNLLSHEDKVRLAESLTACQMIKNVIRSRMEIKKKVNRKKEVVNKLARRLVKKQKQKVVKKGSKCGDEKRIVIDLNINVNMSK